MARGWESKSVESQTEAAEANRSAVRVRKTAPAEPLELIRKRESLLLSRTRVTREMEAAQNPRYRTLLEKSLRELNTQIAAAGGH
ncbi:MAG: hypothetical protein ABSH45_07295 [Bryobacteraceae bacterium]|jgi:hypothetical protein